MGPRRLRRKHWPEYVSLKGQHEASSVSVGKFAKWIQPCLRKELQLPARSSKVWRGAQKQEAKRREQASVSSISLLLSLLAEPHRELAEQ